MYTKSVKTFRVNGWVLVASIVSIVGIGTSFIFYQYGYMIGYNTASDIQKKAAQAKQQRIDEDKFIVNGIVTDLATMSDKYNKLYELCEQKYQYGIDGDYQSAFELKGEMTAIEKEISNISEKYKDQNAILQ